MKEDLLIRKVISVLSFPISPIVSFLFSVKYFRKFYGYVFFLLLCLSLNTNIIFRPQDDIYRHIGVYKMLLFHHTAIYQSIDPYFMGLNTIMAEMKFPVYLAYSVWGLFYFTGCYLCLRRLVKEFSFSYLSVILCICGFFAINPFTFAGIRWGTAAFWFVFFSLKAMENSKTSFWYYMPMLSLMIHFSFIYMLLVFYILDNINISIEKLFRLAFYTFPLPLLARFLDIQKTLVALIPSSLARSFLYYSSSSRMDSVLEGSGIGVYLYLPFILLLMYMLYIVYRAYVMQEEWIVNEGLLRLALIVLIAYHFSFYSYDMMVRNCSLTALVLVIVVGDYYFRNRDSRFSILLLPLFLAFLCWNYDLFFVTGNHVYDIQGFLFSFPSESISECVMRLKGVHY